MSFFSMCIFYLFHGVHFPCRAFSMSCFFHVVHFLFFCFPGVPFLPFSGCDFSAIFRVCIFHSVVFQLCLFCHFLDVIFLPFSGCAFSILSFSSCDFSVIFRGVHFLPFSMSYIFHSLIFWLLRFYHFPGCAFSVIFHVVHFPFLHFPCVLFLSFSGCDFSAIFRVCIFHSVIFRLLLFCH